MIARRLVEHHFRIGVVLKFVSECGVCFSAFNVVCDVFDNSVLDVCLV